MRKGARVASDGGKFRAVNSRDRNFTTGKIASRIDYLKADFAGSSVGMVRVDRQEEGERAENVVYLARRQRRVKMHIQHLQAMDRALADAPDGPRCPCHGNPCEDQRHGRRQRPEGHSEAAVPTSRMMKPDPAFRKVS